MNLMKKYSKMILISKNLNSRWQNNRVRDGNNFLLSMMNLIKYKILTIQDKYPSIVNKRFIIWEEILRFLFLMFGIRILTVELKMQMRIAKKLQRDSPNLIDLEKNRLE